MIRVLLPGYKPADFVYQASYRLEWLRQDIVRANSARLRFVERFEGTDQKHNRNVSQLSILFDVFADFIAIRGWHANIREHYVGAELYEFGQCFITTAKAQNRNAFIGKSDFDNFLDCE